MDQIGRHIQSAATLIFLIGGATFALISGVEPEHVLDGARQSGPLAPNGEHIDLDIAANLPKLYLSPANLVMWALLLAVWGMLLLDTMAQWLNPTPRKQSWAWPVLAMALIFAGVWPWLTADRPLFLAAGSGMMAWAALIAVRRAQRHNHDRNRPGITFFAGWAAAVFSASVAGLLAAVFHMPLYMVAALAILPGAAIGAAAQVWIGPSIAYSAALIWGFCGIAITTMGSDPLTALSAVLGITAMSVVLVRAAS
ncbi:hypothetical protein [Paracoccus sp. (in: a-proteobacteria)]|uniref:hypothetical protein n=1 Tax=Paracoccus sp. TaxID=267 RepID=UPI0026E022F9|nr:hypothetical protein [Paracoccus sp. (in: a-proteobacteria)]MDO5647182.1 hypothetical protein [Paracoccus sp. (in: a-proteobacteria)]